MKSFHAGMCPIFCCNVVSIESALKFCAISLDVIMSHVGDPQRESTADERALAMKIQQWVDSSEGAAQLLQAQKAVRAALESAEKYSEIDPELLQKPVTL